MNTIKQAVRMAAAAKPDLPREGDAVSGCQFDRDGFLGFSTQDGAQHDGVALATMTKPMEHKLNDGM